MQAQYNGTRMRSLLILGLLIATSLVAPQRLYALHSSISVSAAPHMVQLRYRLEPRIEHDRLILHVHLDLSGLTSRHTSLVLPATWGDVNGLGNGVTNLRAESHDTVITDTVDPLRKLLVASDSTSASISYDVVKDWDGPLREDVRHLVHLEVAWIEINTGNALLHPAPKPSETVDCSFDWAAPKSWSIATSFGVGTRRQRFRGAWDRVQNAVFVAGDFRLHEQRQGRTRLVVATRGSWRVPDGEATKRVSDIFALERAFWKDDDVPFYLVTIVPFDTREKGISGGGGFTNAFSIHTDPGEDFTLGLTSLFTHELFHAWNPYKIGQMPNPPEEIYWFTEGFTTYYQSLLLWRGGMISAAQYIDTLNQNLRSYYLSPSRNIPTQELVRLARSGQSKNQVSYDRGAAIALWLDWTIRNGTSSKITLDDVMRALVVEASKQGQSFPELTSRHVFAVADRYLSEDERNQLRSYVSGSSTIRIPAGTLLPCAAMRVVEVPSFDIGMNRNELVKNRVVKDLATGSEAQKAGIHEGDKVTRMSIYWDDVTKPVELTMERDGRKVPFMFYPNGPSMGSVPQFFGSASATPALCSRSRSRGLHRGERLRNCGDASDPSSEVGLSSVTFTWRRVRLAWHRPN